MIKSNLPHKTFNFPVGEMQVTVTPLPWSGTASPSVVDVTFTFTKNDDIIELLLFCDAAKRQNHRLRRLALPYVPFSRQDRCNNPGEAFSLKVFCDLINGLNFQYVMISDPHSDVTPALLNNCIVTPQWDLLAIPVLKGTGGGHFYLVAPDAGALKKTHKLAQQFNTPRFRGVIESSKIRDTKTGNITGTVVHASGLIGNYTVGDQDVPMTYVMADDICDGGRTFIELAKELRSMGAEKVQLYVTHGFFTKGKQVFDGIIDHVYAWHDFSQGER
jgi:ribose-phosphate pyrophosphokinase